MTAVAAALVGAVDDTVLDALEDDVLAEEALFGPMGDDGQAEDPLESAYVLAPVAPYAIDLRRLVDLAGGEVPPAVAAVLGPNIPVLLCHTITAFAPPGRKPAPVWGMGYSVTIRDLPGAVTLSIAPDGEAKVIGAGESHLKLGLDVSGKISLPLGALGALKSLPVALPDVGIQASTGAKAGFVLDFKVESIQIQGGPLAGGGANWSLYRHGRNLGLSQHLFHTVLLPPGFDSITVDVGMWIRRRVLLGQFRKPQQWEIPPQAFTVASAADRRWILTRGSRRSTTCGCATLRWPR